MGSWTLTGLKNLVTLLEGVTQDEATQQKLEIAFTRLERAQGDEEHREVTLRLGNKRLSVLVPLEPFALPWVRFYVDGNSWTIANTIEIVKDQLLKRDRKLRITDQERSALVQAVKTIKDADLREQLLDKLTKA